MRRYLLTTTLFSTALLTLGAGEGVLHAAMSEPSLASFADEAVLPTARDLLNARKVEEHKIFEIERRLKKLLDTPSFRRELARSPLRGIAAYRIGEGGLVFKVTKGDGRLRLAGEAEERDFRIQAKSIGAQIGGSEAWGIVLLLGIERATDFNGEYVGKTSAATALTESSTNTRLMHASRRHLAYFVSTSTGLSANAAQTKLTMSLSN